jgi:hypothetical protein
VHDLRGTDGGLPPIACDLLPLSRAESCTALQDHPPNVYLREDYLTAKINSWVARLFDLARVQRTVEAQADADELAGGIETQAQFRRRIAAAESTMDSIAGKLPDRIDPDNDADSDLLFRLGLTPDRLADALGGEL